MDVVRLVRIVDSHRAALGVTRRVSKLELVSLVP